MSRPGNISMAELLAAFASKDAEAVSALQVIRLPGDKWLNLSLDAGSEAERVCVPIYSMQQRRRIWGVFFAVQVF